MKRRYHDDMTMDAIMRAWPATIRVVLDHGLLCVGCPIAGFHTLEDAIREHGIDAARLRADLFAAIERDDRGADPPRS
jgi:hybrid cluster-associated redox disulfide protein